MTLEILAGSGSIGTAPAFAIIMRAAAGLLFHSVRRPGQPARIERATGRVRPR